MENLVAGILAHVDAGKTTLSEGLLYVAGEIRRVGRVDHRDAFLDTHKIEREKGITIFSKQAVMRLGDYNMTLLDTPGHVDFSTETERTLSVLDCAILVVSGTDGVQSHTETLWRLLRRYNVPTFVFVNKMDLALRTRAELTAELCNRLGPGFVDFTVENEDFFEALSLCDDGIMEKFLEGGNIERSDISAAIAARKVFPCRFGSALKMEGVREFADVFLRYVTPPAYGPEFGARVFKISEDEQKNRLTHMKITGGSLKVRSLVSEGDEAEKINQIRIYSGAKFKAVDEVKAGEVCAVMGLNIVGAGEALGAERAAAPPVLEPVLSYSVILPPGLDPHTALKNLRQLEQEEPQLHIVWDEQHREIHVRLMGAVQLEVLARLYADRFGMELSFGRGKIAYKETVAAPVVGVGHYEPLRHYSEVHLLLEPAARGSGLNFAADCPEEILEKNWQRLVLTHLQERQFVGVLTGSPITDMKITLVSGRASKKHTEGGDFRQATYRAVRQGLRSTENVLLEPWYSFTLEIPAESVGRAMNDIQMMGGSLSLPDVGTEAAVLRGRAPVSEMWDYAAEVVSYTKGTGRLSCLPDGYEVCHNADEVIAEIGYDCDADIANTADSVFCAGGAGFAVPWYEVRNHMHAESGFSFGGEEEAPKREQLRSMARDYVSRAADDAELIRIFERTYGPIKRDERYAVRRESVPAQPKKEKYRPQTPMPTGPEYLLVDGYNVIFAWEELKEIAEENLEAAREALIDTLSNYKGFSRFEIIIVFDAYRVKGQRREVEHVGNLDVVYTKEAETADMYIEKVTHQLSKNHRVRVATSDNLEQVIILAGGALRLSAAELRAEVRQAESAIREILRMTDADKPVEHITWEE